MLDKIKVMARPAGVQKASNNNPLSCLTGFSWKRGITASGGCLSNLLARRGGAA